jgi:hypothetical protein
MQTLLLRSVLFVALAGGCAGTGQLTFAGEATMPELVVIRPGVQVIADSDNAIFYNDNYYWRNEGGYWYRSTSYRDGWIRVQVAPPAIRTIDRPTAYVHYHGQARASTAGERHVVVPAQEVRDHRDDKDRHDDKNRHDKDKHDRHDDKDRDHD